MEKVRSSAPSISGYSITRLLIAAYFIAFSLGLIVGTDISILFLGLLPPVPADIAVNVTVFLAAVSLIMGWQRSVAIFTLAGILFFASYLTLNETPQLGLGRFWSDLVVIAILMLTYADTDAPDNDVMALKAVLPTLRRKKSDQPSVRKTKTRVLSRGSVQKAYTVGRSGRAMSRVVRNSEARVFRDEFETVTKSR